MQHVENHSPPANTEPRENGEANTHGKSQTEMRYLAAESSINGTEIIRGVSRGILVKIVFNACTTFIW